MQIKKVIASFVLSLTLLASATPVFAAKAETANPNQEWKVCTSTEAGPYTSRNAIPAIYNDGTNNWYLKGARSWKGTWYGLYERCWTENL